MTQAQPTTRSDRFGSLSTGTKMLLILSIALLPLGLVAIMASLNSARTTRQSETIEAQAVLAMSAQRLSSALAQAAVIVRIAGDAARNPETTGPGACLRAAGQITGDIPLSVRFALYGPGQRMLCASSGYAPQLPPSAIGATSLVRIDRARETLDIALFNARGEVDAQLEMPIAAIAALTRPADARAHMELLLAAGSDTVSLFDNVPGGRTADEISLSEPVLPGRLELRLRGVDDGLPLSQIVMIVLPLALWLVAALIGWLVVNRLLLQPLSILQRAIAAYRPGDPTFKLPDARSPALEIADLGAAFEQVTQTVARHEAELEAAVERQTRLVREVHHRVKNNLQVVASLLNLHARSSTSEEVSAAYASIQRRVDALAVVHRNHYAELEVNRGVALRTLISELGASLRASTPAGARPVQIKLALEAFYVTQDVAVSVAFLMTETVEFAMICGAASVAIALEDAGDQRARLIIESDVLQEDADCLPVIRERFERIVTGLARQLRSTLERDGSAGRTAVTLAVIGRDDG